MSFASLPQELKLRILLESVQQPREDLHQAAILALLSKDCYSIMSPLLWRHLRITKPSKLRRIHAAVDANPALAGLVTQSIHIGPDSRLPFEGWPVNVRETTAEIEVFLRSTLPEAALPRWVAPGTTFDICYPNYPDCKHLAAVRAIGQAFDDLDVNPRKSGWSSGRGRPERRIGARAWVLRLWMAQAALDLYLAEMRDWEEDGGYPIKPWDAQDPHPRWGVMPPACRRGKCGHYPVLDLKGSSRSESQEGTGVEQSDAERLHLSKQQLWEHLAREGGPADHFDHLLLFARSRSGELNMDQWEWRALQGDLKGPHWSLFLPDEDADEAESQESIEAAWHEQEGAGIEKAEDLLWLAREVLATTQKVTNLSLTGFLHRAINGFGTTDSLRHLNLGPFPPRWEHVLYELSPGLIFDEDGSLEGPSGSGADFNSFFGEATRPRLVKLRICGMISSHDAKKIATQLPSLEKLVWEWTDESDYEGEVLGVVQALQGRRGQFTAAKRRRWEKRSVEIRLLPTAVSRLLATAPSTDTRQAWSENHRASGALHPVKVVASETVQASSSDPEKVNDEEADTQAQAVAVRQHREGHEWWKEGRAGMGLHSTAGEEG